MLTRITTLSRDLAYLMPSTRPNVPPIEYICSGVFLGWAEFLNSPVMIAFEKLIAPTGMIIGSFGTGKSVTAKALLTRSVAINISNKIIFDFHHEYVDYVKAMGGRIIDMKESKINPCQLGATSLHSKIDQLIDMLATIYDFNVIQQRAFKEYAKKAFVAKSDSATFPDIVSEMQKDLTSASPAKRSTLEALLNRIEELAEGPFSVSNDNIALSDVVKGFVCIDLSSIERDELRNALAIAILQFIYNTTLMQEIAKDDEIRTIIMLDEASRTSKNEHSVVVKMVKQLRKYGIALWFAIQDLSDLATEIKSNYGFMIVHKLDNDEYITRIQKDGNFPKEQASRIKTLPVGHAFVRLNFRDAGVPRPFLVRVQMEEVPSLGTGPNALYRDSRSTGSQSLPSLRNSGKTNRIDAADSPDSCLVMPNQTGHKLANVASNPLENLTENERKLLQSVFLRPAITTTQHYRAAGLNNFQGPKAKAMLKERQLIRETKVPSTNKVLLELTPEAKQLLGGASSTKRFGGPVHQNIVNSIADKLRKLNHVVHVEPSIGQGKKPDLVVDNEIAVEVELEESRLSNILKNLRAGFDRVIVVCKKSDIAKFRKRLPARLASDSRVQITDIPSLPYIIRPEYNEMRNAQTKIKHGQVAEPFYEYLLRKLKKSRHDKDDQNDYGDAGADPANFE